MHIYYISPSSMPTKAANSIHVANMCNSFSDLGHDVKLFVHSACNNKINCIDKITEHYSIDLDKVKLVFYKSKLTYAREFFIFFISMNVFLYDSFKGKAPEAIISRNLFGAFFFGFLLKRKVIYETHCIEDGYRRILQKIILNTFGVYCVVISKSLKSSLVREYKLKRNNIRVMHDAADHNVAPLSKLQRTVERKRKDNKIFSNSRFDKYIGYFGHLYPGRGIEIIQRLAEMNPNIAFVIYGGNDNDIQNLKDKITLDNFFIMGFVHPKNVKYEMSLMDILLMPYQQKVSIGIKDSDTSKWMSPMKMFEYMSVRLPIISSNLPVLREVLINDYNCLLVGHSSITEWSDAVNRLLSDIDLSDFISNNAYCDFLKKYTWKGRAERMLNLLSK